MLENLKVINCKNCPNIVLSFFDKTIFIGNTFDYDTLRYDLCSYLEKYIFYKDGSYYDISTYVDSKRLKEGIVKACKKTPTGAHSSFYCGEFEDIKISDLIDIKDFFSSLFFMDVKINGRIATFYKYQFNLEDDTLNIILKDTLDFLDNADFNKDEEELTSFLEGVCINESLITESFNRLFFNRNKDKIGYRDIYLNLFNFFYRSRSIFKKISEESLNDKKDSILCSNYFMVYSYLLKDEYFGIFEKLIKEDRESLILSFNPVFTKKPIPDIKSIRSLSTISKEILKGYNDSNLASYEKLLLEIEDSPKFGIDGLSLCKKFFDTIQKVNKNLVYDWQSPFKSYSYNSIKIIDRMYKIVNIFDISVKDLLDKMIRAIFYYNMDIDHFINITLDYVDMMNSLKLEIPKKFPKEIIEGHNRLKRRQDYLSNKEIEDKFNKALIFNEGNLACIPNHKKFTIISPKSSADLINEGLYLNHCVGSYVEKFALRYSKIYFVRLIGAENTPFVTVELDKHDNLVQMSCMNDKNPDKEVWDFVLEWVNNLK